MFGRVGPAIAFCSLVLVSALAGLAVGPRLGWGFYAPRVGAVAHGRPDVASRQATRRRNVVRVRIETHMLDGNERTTTLAKLARLYGLEDTTVPCSVRESDRLPSASGPLVQKLAREPRKVGDEVILCLE